MNTTARSPSAAARSGCALFLAVMLAAKLAAAETQSASRLSDFATLERVVAHVLAKRSDYQPGDLLSRAKVQPVFTQLAKIGLTIHNQQKILASIPAKADFVVRQLQTERGRLFMRKIARYPDAYDRLERLAALPRGHQIIEDLIRTPGGEKMVGYLTNSQGGKNMGRMLSCIPQEGNFNAPTGQIFTEEQLIKRLQKSCLRAAKITESGNHN